MKKLLAVGIASVACSLAVACGGDPSGDTQDGALTGAGSKNGAANPPQAGSADGGATAVVLSGDYELSSTFDLTTAGVFPDAANGTLKGLSDLKDNPAKAIIDVLQANNVPIVSTVLGYLPTVLRDSFEGFINDTVFAALFANAPVTKSIASLIEDIAKMTTQFEVVSSLHLPPASDTGSSTGTHALRGVAFTVVGKRTVFEAPSLLTGLTRADHVDASLVHIVERSPTVENGRLNLNDHAFGVPIGGYVNQAIDALAQASLGAPTLREALGKMLDCKAIGEAVANRCVGPVCVGHSASIEEMCASGLDAIASQVKSRMEGLNLNVVHLKSGEAQMWDAPTALGALDGKIDRIDNGTWAAALNVSKGEHPVVASFVGHRVGDGAASGTTP